MLDLPPGKSSNIQTEELGIPSNKEDASFISSRKLSFNNTAKMLIEYFSMVDELILVANCQMKVIGNNFSEKIMGTVVSKMPKRFDIEALQEGKDKVLDLEAMFQELESDSCFCGLETCSNLIRIQEDLLNDSPRESRTPSREDFLKSRKVDGIIKSISMLREEMKKAEAKEPRLELINKTNKVLSSLQAADLSRDNLVVGSCNADLRLHDQRHRPTAQGIHPDQVEESDSGRPIHLAQFLLSREHPAQNQTHFERRRAISLYDV